MRRVLMVLLALVPSLAWAELDPQALSRAFDRLYRADSSRSQVRMTVHTPHYERTLAMQVLSQGMERTLVRISKPRKEKASPPSSGARRCGTTCPRCARPSGCPPR